MELDIRTLLLVHTLVTVSLAALMALYWRAHPRTPGVGLWTLGTALVGLGTLGGFLRGFVPDLLSIPVAHGALALGTFALWNGIRRFDDKPVRWAGCGALVALLVAFLYYRTDVSPDAPQRLAALSLVLGSGVLLCAGELLSGTPRCVRMTARVAAALFAVVGVSFLLRAIQAVGPAATADLVSHVTARGPHVLVSIVANVLTVFSLLLMAAQRLHHAVEERNAELVLARDRAEAASRAKTQFLAMMSHELRTPLNAIIGFSDVMRSAVFGPLGHERYRVYAEDIHASGHHLLGLITAILDISKAEAGKLEIAPEPVDLPQLVQDAVRLARVDADRKGIHLTVEIAETRPFRADPMALRQILLNLLTNGIKFTASGGRVSLQVHASGSGTAFRVVDDGIGMDPAEIPRLLRPFEQASPGLAAANGGTGLGLPLVDTLVRLHGGRFEIQSHPGRGTAATVWLPQVPSVQAVA
ncbi:sensor histidine kinase [Arenibaculum pallidiluteum]|uniref:sensor histidine kinase n=1 Tax=Arenibaculum pallidiluteum TaxID=2812559 RepID=UPI001A967364|nr:HAMP domain-containing sensor histidine kinase [Arenibaculum pallidiluteum]